MAGLVFLKEIRLTATTCQLLISGTGVLDTFGAYRKLAFGFGFNLRGSPLIIQFFVLRVFSGVVLFVYLLQIYNVTIQPLTAVSLSILNLPSYLPTYLPTLGNLIPGLSKNVQQLFIEQGPKTKIIR